jgi:hypothetical protein
MRFPWAFFLRLEKGNFFALINYNFSPFCCALLVTRWISLNNWFAAWITAFSLNNYVKEVIVIPWKGSRSKPTHLESERNGRGESTFLSRSPTRPTLECFFPVRSKENIKFAISFYAHENLMKRPARCSIRTGRDVKKVGIINVMLIHGIIEN